ncbi:MAG TPA: single-stranded DNA-binding protein [Solirubrobacterales bacterium]
MQNVNVVAITGNLTHDPELSHTGGGTAVARLRVAVNARRKDSQTGEWVDKPNFFNVTVWGNQGVACSEHLEKGRPVAIQGRLDWREWEAKDGSGKREAVQIVADTVQFLNARPKTDEAQSELAAADEPVAAGAGAGGSEDDIPF